MDRMTAGLAAVVATALLGWPTVAPAQTRPEPYRPLTNVEMSERGIWNQWVTTFNELTPKQRAEVVRRHIRMCLDSLEVTEEQRALVSEFSAKFVTEKAYGTTDPEERAALQRDMQPLQEKAMSLLGPDLARTFFLAKPPISVLEDVKKDLAFR